MALYKCILLYLLTYLIYMYWDAVSGLRIQLLHGAWNISLRNQPPRSTQPGHPSVGNR